MNAVAVDGGMSASAMSAAAAAAAPAAAVEEGAACYLRPGDDGFEECEACQ
ncbi:hypothetical protein LP420_25855 [Massilia sp. B-10]|nr:hypothetical protein LP420_25855 [Massilia sp. B-10]